MDQSKRINTRPGLGIRAFRLLPTAPMQRNQSISLYLSGNKVSPVLQALCETSNGTLPYKNGRKRHAILTLGEHAGEDALYLRAIARGEIPIDGALQAVAK